jgi:hypothetical protein
MRISWGPQETEAKTETQAALAKKQTGSGPQEEKENKNENQSRVGARSALHVPLTVAGDKDVYPKERVTEFIVEKLDVTSLSCAPAEKGKRKENFCGLRIHGAGDE